MNTLEQYAMDHYSEGGHWVFETYSDDDYQKVLDEAKGDLEAAKAEIKARWLFLVEQETECGFGDGADW